MIMQRKDASFTHLAGHGLTGLSRLLRHSFKPAAGSAAMKGTKGLQRAGIGMRKLHGTGMGKAVDFGLPIAAIVGALRAPNSPWGHLALASAEPVVGAAQAIPGAIHAVRAGLGHYDDKFKETAMSGARDASSEFLQALSNNPEAMLREGAYRGALGDNALLKKYVDGDATYNGPGLLPSIMTGDMSKYFSGKVRGAIQEGLENPTITKEARNLLRPIANAARGAGKVLLDATWRRNGKFGKAITTGALGYSGYAAGKAALSGPDKASLDAIRQEGYRAAQAKLADALDKMPGWQRSLATFDPSLVASRMEELAPGTIEAWEKSTGNTYQPGMIASVRDAWTKGKEPQYLTRGPDGNIYL